MLRTDEVCNEIMDELSRNLQDVGTLCTNYAKIECPVDSGILRSSIDNQVITRNAIGKIVHNEEARVVLYANTDYAAIVHEGHGYFQGVPYLENAVYNNLAEIRAILAGKR